MAVDIKLPNLGDGISSGDVLSVLVKEGDQVAKEQGIVELETGKATIEVPSTHAGKVVKVHVSKGQTVPIGGSLISVEPSEKGAGKPAAAPKGEAPKAEAPKAEAPAKAKPEPAKPASKSPKPPPKAEPARAKAPAAESAPRPAPKPAAPRPTEPEPAAEEEEVAEPAAAEGGFGVIPASPAVRRFAREVGVDLGKLSGTGEGGRITREDVLAVVRRASQAVSSGTLTPPGDVLTDDWGPIRVEKMPKIRQTIAAKMHESWTTVPRVTNFDDADVTELERFRQASKDDYAARGIRLTTLPFVVKSVAMALRQHPIINASVDVANGQIIHKEYVNVGIAVDSDRGLVVPSLRNADKLSIPEIALGVAALAEKIRTNQFTIDDLRGSTFTISNLGAIGGTYSTPIVNTPEVAILLVGRARKLAVVIDDQIVVRLMMPLSLSYDHRLVDGAAAARFLNDVMGYLKAPSRLLLAI